MLAKRPLKLSCVLVLLALVAPVAARAQNTPSDSKLFDNIEWRAIGPANMMGRATDVEGIPGNASIVYVATASGGLWKTINAGTTWAPIFERQGTLSIGDMALDPKNPDVIWVGSGESNTRNSVSFGDGVYKSTDGGNSWTHMGLRETERISRIVINPLNTDIVYIGALGHAFGPNPERGVFMTTDGGKTWQKTLYTDPEHGIADLDIDPSNPNVLYAAMWSFERKPWTFRSGSEKGGVYKSIDGGRTWKKLETGLPKLIGRIGVKVAPSSPNVVYVIVESKDGILYRSDDHGETFTKVSSQTSIVSRGFYYTDIRVDPTDENRVYAIATNLFVSIDGGKTFRTITGKTHIDYHGLWIDPKNPSRLWQVQDGGAAVSYDRGETWDYANNFPLGQFYQIYADNRLPFYYVMGGLQDNGSWSGPSRTREPAGILNDDWRMISFGDGFYIFNHPDDPELYLSESQGGNVVRTDFRNREQQAISPMAARGGAAVDVKYRFNWNSPLIPSPHDKNTVYIAGNVVFRSTDFGKTWERISGDLTTDDKEKQKEAGGPIGFENSTAEYYCTIISLAESPIRPGVIWAGTDDGNLQLTTDGGRNWTNIIRNVSGVPANSPVSHVEPSRKNADVAYVSFDRHMFDDFKPYVFRTTDGGRSWSNVTGDLPRTAYVHIVREDPKSPDLLYAGTEIGLFVSYTGGSKWIPLNLKNLPNVPVHDIIVHPRENDLILGTHGRSIWILDDATPIQKMNQSIEQSDVHLFDIRAGLRHTMRFTRYGISDRPFTGPNPPYGALITYYLKEKPDEKTSLTMEVLDRSGKVITEIKNLPKEKGLNRAAWDLRYDGPRPRRPSAPEEPSFFGGPSGPQALPGTYTVRLKLGDKTVEKSVEVRMDPTVTVSTDDLRTVFDMTMSLREMRSATNDALRALDSIKEQLERLEKTVKDRVPNPSDADLKLIADHIKQVDGLLDKLASRPGGLGFSGRPRVSQRLGSLASSIDGVNAPPTPTQREFYEELRVQSRQELTEVNSFLTTTVRQLNGALRGRNLPTIIAGEAVQIPQG